MRHATSLTVLTAVTLLSATASSQKPAPVPQTTTFTAPDGAFHFSYPSKRYGRLASDTARGVERFIPMREILQRTPKWPRWMGLVGAVLFLGGLAWMAVWDHSNRGGPDWLRLEAHPPFPSREMVFFGFVLLLVVGARVGLSFVRSLFSGKGR